MAEQAAATILSYHEIGDPAFKTIPRPGAPDNQAEELRYAVRRDDFKAQLDYLEVADYHVIALSDLVDYVAGRRKALPPKAVVITVDDGWLSAYTDVFPELHRRAMPFTLFIYPDVIGKGPAYVTWAQVGEMASAGVDIEGHTYTHASLALRSHPNFEPADYSRFLQHELLDSKRAIEQEVGRPVRFLAYPYSDYDSDVESAVKRYGYEAALYDRDAGAFIHRATPLLHLKRFPVLRDTSLSRFKTFLVP
ncbi:MAG TPA: polysaccharide deacetylase family protein [Thermoanaerobaculia bacterium]|nr:polysaccharide deacetylase family protein [Thermoanaerobaculia bacterium]